MTAFLRMNTPLMTVVSRCLAAFSLMLCCSTGFAQTCGIPGWDGPITASGIINSYHGGNGSPIGGGPGVGATSITVASATGLRTNNRALRVGDLILIMQMQDSSTGGNAGLHEYAQITAISGTTISLNRALTNSYNQSMSTAAVRNWQVVWVPQYSAATISGTVNADRWTSDASTGVVSGGVVAMDVAGSLTLNGTVTVAGSGFRGAMGLQGTSSYGAGTATTPNSTFTPTSAATIYGGQKGEGNQGTPPRVFDGTTTPVNYSTLLGQGYALGAGGQAAIGNAGGGANDGLPATGGNQYNSGGGGGGNAGAGGQGGNSWNSNGLASDLNQNQTTTQTGNIAGGKGGNLQTGSATRLVLGGGGGAGSTNNTTGADSVTTWPPNTTSTVANGAAGALTSSGASGGGVVLIRAGSFSATAGVIDARGYSSYNKSPAADTDSAGGGGAGGSVFLVAGSGTGTGLTINAAGGNGGSSSYFNHGPGGGGGGGFILSSLTAATQIVTGGTNGIDGCCGGTNGNGSPKAWNSAPGATGSSSTAGGAATGVQGGAACLPVINVTKSTTTPTVTTAISATTTYAINVSNSGGAATNMFLFDANLPPNWAYASAPATTYSYSPIPPGAGSSGAETTAATLPAGLPVNTALTANSATAVSLRANGAAPGLVPTVGSNSPTFGSFYLPQNGSITVSFAVSIPDTATVGTYHNPAGVIYLDPTRTTAAGIRMLSPGQDVSSNRANIPYSNNTTYVSGSTTNVAGSNYNGFAAGPASEDVTLLPDLSVTKTLSTSTFTVGVTGQKYIITGRNNGRPVADQVYANTQATAQSATSIVSPALSITDTLPTGMTLTTATTSNNAVWSCTANATSTTFTCAATAAVYPLPAATDIVTVTATVTVSALACPGPRVNTVTIATPAIGDSVPANNTGTVATPIGCSTNLSVTKTDAVSSVTAGGTTNYTVTFANLGPATADGATVTDTPGTGLSCTVTACSFSGTGVCPAAGQWPNLLSGGLALGSFASGATVSFVVSCGITATGQ